MNFLASNTEGNHLSQRIDRRDFPQIIKYMGSKASLIDFVVEGISEVYVGGQVCDLFAGACSLAGAIGHSVPMVVNDIQSYSSIIAHLYLHRLSKRVQKLSGEEIFSLAEECASTLREQFPFDVKYPESPILSEFNDVEERNRSLIQHDFQGSHHLFTKNYSGTWWSADQCVLIDGLRYAADNLMQKNALSAGDRDVVLSCVMHAMAYCSQGTGHYAQYRDAKNSSSLADINIYRHKSVRDYFIRRWELVKEWNSENVTEGNHMFRSEDYQSCLLNLEEGGTVYADPPYAFVHYSRFYHAIETFVLYDYPDLQSKGGALVKGRYREKRHQSPFSIRSAVPSAFKNLFNGVDKTCSNLVLSYSDTGLFKLDELHELACRELGERYEVSIKQRDHKHMTMGRKQDSSRDVKEALILAKRYT